MNIIDEITDRPNDSEDAHQYDITLMSVSDIKLLRHARDDIALLLAEVKRLEGERDEVLRNLSACKPWLKNRLPFNVAKSVDDACAVIEAARKMRDE